MFPYKPVCGHHSSNQGFTLLEIILVSGIIAVLLAVIVPQAIRISTSSKYALVEQAATEIGKWGMEWGTRNLESQASADSCVLDDYIATLAATYTGNQNSNWSDDTALVTPACHGSGNLQYAVASMIDPAQRPRNPFNGVSYFAAVNDGSTLYPGLLYLATAQDTLGGVAANNYYFLYTGTESQSVTQWHGGMGQGANPALANLKNGIFMARLVP